MSTIYATVHGRQIGLSDEESERIRNRVTEDVLRSLASLRTYIEAYDAYLQDDTPGKTKPHGTLSGLELTAGGTAESLRLFFEANNLRVPERLRNG